METKKENSKNLPKNDDGTDLRRLPQPLATRSVRGLAAHETTWIPARTVGVSNYIRQKYSLPFP